MKKIFFCLMAVIALVSCGNKTRNPEDRKVDEINKNEKIEVAVTEADDQGQSEWTQQTTITTTKPMVIDFYATWCAPCKKIAPILDELEKVYHGKVTFRRVDVDKETDLAAEFDIKSIPMLMFITPNGEYQTLVGLQDKDVIDAKINELLKRS
ncbi:MAG: thioredoxin [Muribaculaceae bacterium]|nr:thioredoxin [Muribaculaceae bacterium]